MAKIETGLHEYHASMKDSSGATAQSATATSSSGTGATSRNTASNAVPEVAFAKVNSVVAGSPAEDAGLEAGDEIIRFGEAHWMNHEKLSKVAQIVQRNEGVSSRS